MLVHILILAHFQDISQCFILLCLVSFFRGHSALPFEPFFECKISTGHRSTSDPYSFFYFYNFCLNHQFPFSPVASGNIRNTKHKNWNTAMTLRIQEMYNLSILFHFEGVIFSLMVDSYTIKLSSQ